jgi:hypothetical protein
MRLCVRKFLKLAAIVTAGAAVTLTAGLPAALATAEASYWRVEYRLPASEGLIAQMTAPARHDAWALGDTAPRHGVTKTFLLHWTGRGWHKVTPPHPAGFVPTQIMSSSPGDVWVFGQKAGSGSQGDEFYALVYDGSRWTTRALPSGVSGDPAVVLSSTDAWAESGGSCVYPQGTPRCSTVEHWNGSTWTPSTVPTSLQALAGSGRHAWLAGLSDVKNSGARVTGRLALYKQSAGQWKIVRAPLGEIGAVTGLAAAPNGRLWLMTASTNRKKERLSFWNGRIWTTKIIPSGLGVGNPFCYDGHNGVWAGAAAHWTGTRWVNTSPSLRELLGVYTVAPIPGTDSAWGNGQDGSTRSVIQIYGPLP